MRNVVQLCLAAVWQQIIFCSCVNKTFLLLIAIALAWKMVDRFASRRYSWKNKLCDRMIKQLLDEVEQYIEICQWPVGSIICRSLLICLSEKPRIYFIFQLMSERKWYSGTYPLGHLYSRVSSIKSLISLRVHKLQWRTLSKHELSHLNRCTALVGIQHTP